MRPPGVLISPWRGFRGPPRTFTRRCFATQPALRAPPPPSSDATNSALDFATPTSSKPRPSSLKSTRISDLLQDLTKPQRAGSSPQGGRPAAQQARSEENASFSDGLAELLQTATDTDRGKQAAVRQGNIARGMTSTTGQDVREIMSRQRVEPLAPPLRLDAYMGRSQQVGPLGLAVAIQRLDAKLGRNRVKADFNYQKFHERPGLKRKRLKSERWRRRFKEGFMSALEKVQKMRAQGW